MKKRNISLSFLVLLFFTSLTAIAQPTNERGWYDRKDVENVEVGWLTKLSFKEPAKPFSQHGWIYPANQMDITQKIITWMQQTFTCKGLLGEPKLTLLAPPPALPLSNSSHEANEAEKENKKALPNTYGAYVRFHHNLVKTSTKKFYPMSGNMSYMCVNILANNIELISRQKIFLSTPDEYYCVMPKYSIGMKGEFDRDYNENMARYRNFTNSPNLKKYEHYLIPGQSLSGNGAFYAIIMTKDGKPLPFEQVTFHEMISKLEKQLPTMYQVALNQNSKMDNMLEKAKRGIQILKDNYRNNLNDFVYIASLGTMIDLIDLANLEPGKKVYWLSTDQNSGNNVNWPLLRLKKGVKQSCATGGPQWIVFRLDAVINQSDAGNVELMDNFVNRFNYEYVYNYFFGKDKVIEPYKPLAFVSNEEKVNSQSSTELSAEARKMQLINRSLSSRISLQWLPALHRLTGIQNGIMEQVEWCL